jgi:surface antigen
MRPVEEWGDASQWLTNAKRDGYATGSTPVAGAVAWRWGHVAYVLSVSGSNMTIKEANYDYRGSVRTITVPVSSYSAFIY